MIDDGAFSSFSTTARRRLPALFADYLDGGAHGERTMAQIYVMRDRTITLDMLERARSCGIRGIILTIDTAITPVRERDARNGFRHLSRPTIRQLAGLTKHPRWLAGMRHRHMHKVGNIERYTASRGVMAQDRDIASQIDPSLSWDDLAWLRAHWKGTLVVKGVMHPDDAYQIAEACADGIIVSNHGGRQMDPAPSALDVLPAIADRLAGRLDWTCRGLVPDL